ncbi:MAG: hypothetical protein QW507_02910 [Candidatus Nanoarchaeia archaeon]|nr:hypothetical protein [Candidatus Haiyanarchaeum thermophilum]MCW1303066.1 hypothetical protein [Candidatus Haiyanarchaeum thermophilum]MCW1303731.1 hypothetical protein [Candidatus Haiyanarchaeum thermophilum]MCW1306824.1 hypothetical protein [Candidatus Haiyanarchaeum thermophilum]MCW1307066.1 hypothetical protein [Candidatus Haiyanarchaeum thermophilum]
MYFKLNELEKVVNTKVYDEIHKQEIERTIIFRENPIFMSRARIEPSREERKIETDFAYPIKVKEEECFFCHPNEKCSKFRHENLSPIYFLNESVVFSNLYPIDEIMGVVVYDYKRHVVSPLELNSSHWRDGLLLVKKVFESSGKKYVYNHLNFGPKSAASIEHFHGQFICSNYESILTSRVRENARKLEVSPRLALKSWIEALDEKGLILKRDENTSTYLFVEWAPVFGKSELVITSTYHSNLGEMEDLEIQKVAEFLELGSKLFFTHVSNQFTIINVASFKSDEFCNQFRIVARAPLEQGMKSWEGFLELSGESVPNILPEALAQKLKNELR